MARYQSGPLQTSSAAMAPQRDMSTAAGYSDPYYTGATGSSYATASIPQSAMGYQTASTSYGPPDARQPQSYPTSSYNPSTAAMLYNAQAQSAQNTPVYDTSQQYSSRQPAGLPLMNPDVTGHYYQNGPSGVPSAASAMQPQSASSGASQAVYQQQPSNMQSYGNMTSMGGMTPQTNTTAGMSMEEQALPVEEDPSETFEHYDSTLREVFARIKDSDLVTASETLVSASTLLRDGVARFGMYFSTAKLN